VATVSGLPPASNFDTCKLPLTTDGKDTLRSSVIRQRSAKRKSVTREYLPESSHRRFACVKRLAHKPVNPTKGLEASDIGS
jgi:hypothetical protein